MGTERHIYLWAIKMDLSGQMFIDFHSGEAFSSSLMRKNYAHLDAQMKRCVCVCLKPAGRNGVHIRPQTCSFSAFTLGHSCVDDISPRNTSYKYVNRVSYLGICACTITLKAILLLYYYSNFQFKYLFYVNCDVADIFL